MVLFGAFGLTSLLAGTKSGPRPGELIASDLAVPLYVLAICTLVWARFGAWFTHTKVERCRSPPDPAHGRQQLKRTCDLPTQKGRGAIR